MTREQLDAIRARVDELNATNGHEPAAWEENRLSMADTNALLAEVEGMRESCTGLVKQNERQYDEVVRLTAERDAAWVHEVEHAAFQRGAEAMRAAILQRVSWGSDLVRDEPLPEDKS